MKDLLLTLLHWAVMTATLCGPGGVRAVIAENLLLKQQLIVLRRPRQRAPRLTASDRLLFGFGSLFLSPGRIRKVAIGVRPSTLLAFHQALVRRKYRRLFSSSECPKQPGPKGPSEALIQAIVELTSRNPRFGCPRIARIISRTFEANIDKHVVYRVLSTHYRPIPGGGEVEAHHPEQGVQEPFGLAQREMIEEPQGQGGLDGEIRVPPLPAPPAAPAGGPGSDRLRGQPHRHRPDCRPASSQRDTSPYTWDGPWA